MWGLPMFDSYHSGVIMEEIKKCRDAHPREYIRVNAFDSTRGWETVRLSFIVNRPQVEPGFELVREEGRGRTIHYTLKRRVRSERR